MIIIIIINTKVVNSYKTNFSKLFSSKFSKDFRSTRRQWKWFRWYDIGYINNIVTVFIVSLKPVLKHFITHKVIRNN